MNNSSVKCMIAGHAINYFLFKFLWAALIGLYFFPDSHEGTGFKLVLIPNLWFVFMLYTPPYVIYNVICLCYWEEIVKEHVVICYSKKFNMYCAHSHYFFWQCERCFSFLLFLFLEYKESPCYCCPCRINWGGIKIPVFHWFIFILTFFGNNLILLSCSILSLGNC